MNIISKIKPAFQKKSVIGVTALSLITIIYFGFFAPKSGDGTISYALAAVSKGTIIVNVSGTGQADTKQQTDIKPKVSGELISLNIKNGQEVKAGTVIGQIDSTTAQRTVRDATINLENAKISLAKLKEPADKYEILKAQNELDQAKNDLEELQSSADEDDLLTAQNAVSQAQRAYDQAVANESKTNLDSTQSLNKAYDDGYNAVSDAYLDMPDLMQDLYDVQWGGTDFADERVADYKLILGESSKFITSTVDDYDDADDLFDTSFSDYKSASRTDDRESLYALIDETLQTAKAISQAMESARNMFDTITTKDYDQYSIAATVDSLKTTITADISEINALITDLQNAKDSIDDINSSSPTDIQKSKDSVTSAQESLTEKQKALETLIEGADELDIKAAEATVAQKQNALDDLLAGTDELDIRAQELSVSQKANSLADAQETLSDYTIKAPYDCIVATVNVNKGDTVSSGTSIATVITNQLLAEVALNEVDITTVKIGQKATLTFDAIEDLSITGEVAEIDTLATASSGVVSYNVRISFDTQDERIKTGMSVSADIITDAIQDALLLPNAAVKTQDDVNYVEILPNQTAATTGAASSMTVTSATAPQQQEIEIGIANDTNTQIIGDTLKEGDLVVLKTVTASGKTATSTKSSSGGAMNMLSGGGGPPN